MNSDRSIMRLFTIINLIVILGCSSDAETEQKERGPQIEFGEAPPHPLWIPAFSAVLECIRILLSLSISTITLMRSPSPLLQNDQ